MLTALVRDTTMESGIPRWRRSDERLAEKSMLVPYDSRGSGLSDREVSDFSLDAMLLVLEAVVDSAGLQGFARYGQIQSGQWRQLMPLGTLSGSRA